jgi:ATP-dependent exoDNAse (exonuclease V) alpha subunit
MAIFHMSVKTVGRSAGRTATAAAAYRACEVIACERQGITHDYTKKRGLVHAEIIAPDDSPPWASNRAALWNAAESAETRKNSTVAREFEIALPAELNAEQRKTLAQAFTRELVERHGFAADLCIHDDHDRNQNHHAHILCTTRVLTADGFTTKTRELDEKTSGTVDRWRERWAELVNEALERHGHADRVDHRTLAAQGVERAPTQHLGAAAKGYERRTGQPSDKRQRQEQAAADQRTTAVGNKAQIMRLNAQIERLTDELAAEKTEQPEQITRDKTDSDHENTATEAPKTRFDGFTGDEHRFTAENTADRLKAVLIALARGEYVPSEPMKRFFDGFERVTGEQFMDIMRSPEAVAELANVVKTAEQEQRAQGYRPQRPEQDTRDRSDNDMSH